jgi:predicted nucleic acid-binding protein
MGLILDTGILIVGDRRKETVKQVLQRVQTSLGEATTALSTVSIVELTHGVYRAKTESERLRRKAFCDELCQDMIVHPVSLEIAQLAGRIEGEQAAKGIAIGFEDLLIGATALHLGFDVVTLNVKHFQLIPDLKILTI